ncbi:MAG: hypothetical protein H6644_01420 [Caldilineaceae bacterium]|nr:hypothetical protein [Caldilineaceae bacterium]
MDVYRAAEPELAYIVLVGNDDVIPFFRYPDTALLGDESNYLPPVQDDTASQASLRCSYVLSQDRVRRGGHASRSTQPSSRCP